MPTGNDPLLHAIVAAFHDPAPERAFRHRPFVYGLAPPRFDGGPPGGLLRWRFPVLGGVFAAALRLVPGPRPAAPRCEPACC